VLQSPAIGDWITKLASAAIHDSRYYEIPLNERILRAQQAMTTSILLMWQCSMKMEQWAVNKGRNEMISGAGRGTASGVEIPPWWCTMLWMKCNFQNNLHIFQHC